MPDYRLMVRWNGRREMGLASLIGSDEIDVVHAAMLLFLFGLEPHQSQSAGIDVRTRAVKSFTVEKLVPGPHPGRFVWQHLYEIPRTRWMNLAKSTAKAMRASREQAKPKKRFVAGEVRA